MADRVHPAERSPATRAYVERRTAEGLSKTEIIRCLKRYVAREVYPHLRGWRCQTPGDGLARDSAAADLLAFERFVGRPGSHSQLLARDLIRACAPPGAAHP